MRISSIGLTQESTYQELSASIDRDRLWFRFPADHPLACRAEPFVAAALPVAMRQGAALEVDAPLSPVFLEAIHELQDVFHCWNPELRPVAVNPTGLEAAPSGPRTTAAFFSGGVDSLFTLLRHEARIADLVFFASGFDLESTEVAQQRIARYRQLADERGKRLIAIEMNFRAFSDREQLRWGFAHGFALAAVSLALGAETMLVASGQTYRHLEPWGSHPLTDAMWRTEAVRVVHDGAGVSRYEKTARLVRDPHLLQHLHVCWAHPLQNCGRCSKCLRTAAALRLLGVSSPVLAPLKDARLLRRLRPHNERQAEFLIELLDAARERGDRDVVNVLRQQLWKFDMRELAIAADRVLLGSALKRLYLRATAPDWQKMTAPAGRRR